MADWASKANHNNPLFTIYHTLQFAKHKGMYWGKKEVYRLLRPRMREHFRYASRAPPSRTGARNVKDGPFFRCFVTLCHIAKFCLHDFLYRHVLSPRTETFVTLFQQHCNTSFLFPRCVSVCVNALARCVTLCFIIPASDKD